MIVAMAGHVDHGKTSLIRALTGIDPDTAPDEKRRGMTIDLGFAHADFPGAGTIGFVDVPGHERFLTNMLAGVLSVDSVLLVVAADDGFMPQTEEALKIALAEKQNHPERFALLVAVNKMDVKGANLDQVKNQMQQRGIAPEDWGGETITVPVAAIKNQGISELLDMVLLQADVLELKANPKAEASGVIIESEIDFGRGPLATVIVQRGTLRVGDDFLVGFHAGRVRALLDERGDGAVITTIHSRTGTRMYVKRITEGKGEKLLGEEEEQAVAAALPQRRCHPPVAQSTPLPQREREHATAGGRDSARRGRHPDTAGTHSRGLSDQTADALRC